MSKQTSKHNRETINQFSNMGHVFERLVDEVLTFMGVEYRKNESGVKGLEPDYVFNNNVWADAKLSAYANTQRSRDKYLPHCDELYLIHLVGGQKAERTLDDGTHLISLRTVLDLAKLSTNKGVEAFEERAIQMTGDYYRLMNGDTVQEDYGPNLPMKEIQERYVRGESSVILANAYETTTSTILRRLRLMGTSIRKSNYLERSVEERDSAINEYESGTATQLEIEEKYGVTPATMSEWISNYGTGKRTISETDKEKVVKEYNVGGTSYRKLANKYGVSPKTIGNWVNA